MRISGEHVPEVLIPRIWGYGDGLRGRNLEREMAHQVDQLSYLGRRKAVTPQNRRPQEHIQIFLAERFGDVIAQRPPQRGLEKAERWRKGMLDELRADDDVRVEDHIEGHDAARVAREVR